MIVWPDAWPQVATRREGDLAELPVGLLFSALAGAGSTTAVEFERRQVRKTVILERGAPVDCRSNLLHETLGRFLLAEGKVEAENLASALSESAARDLPLGEVLLARGALRPVDLFRLLQQNLAKKLLDLFTWSDGRFTISPELPVVRSSLRVKVPQLVLTGIVRFAPQAQIDAAAAALVGERLEENPSPPFDLAELRWSEAQNRVLAALRTGGRLDELAAGTALPLDVLSRTVYALALLGAAVPASFARRRRAEITPRVEPPAPAPAPPPPAPATAPESVEPAAAETLGDEVMQAVLRYRQQDSFDFFGLPEEADSPAIDDRFLELAARFAPSRFASPALAAYAERARDLFLAAARSYAELADSESRGGLIFRRKTLREQAARRPAQHAIRTDLLDPEVQFRKGREHFAAGRLREAIQQFEFAADCDPQNGLYRAELAWARVRHAPGAAVRAVQELEEALRIDPQCGLASYYAGILCGDLGRLAEAEAHLRAAGRRLAPDRRPIEALKALAGKKKH